MTYRTPLLARNPAPKASVRTTDAGTRGRPITKLFTIEEVAETLNVSSRTVRRLIESGALPVHRLGRLVRIAHGDLAAFLAASRSV
jgi:excisionase family DNA binding protein